MTYAVFQSKFKRLLKADGKVNRDKLNQSLARLTRKYINSK